METLPLMEMVVFGDVAQLVERLHGMQEVESSILFVSTSFGRSRKRCWYATSGVFWWSEGVGDFGGGPL